MWNKLIKWLEIAASPFLGLKESLTDFNAFLGAMGKSDDLPVQDIEEVDENIESLPGVDAHRTLMRKYKRLRA